MRRSLCALLLASSLVGIAACSDETESSTADATAFTVERGDRFVVSAEAGRIVLKKKVDDVMFPFDEKSLQGKAVLIDPVSGRAADGVYARAIDVRSEGENYVVEGHPLTLREMAEMTEDEIVRIYIDVKASAKKDNDGPMLVPESWTGLASGVRPTALGIGGVGFAGFDFTGMDFKTPVSAMPGISFKHTVEKASLAPEVLAEYTSDSGLQLGFRGSIAFKSTIEISGRVGGEIFKSKTLRSPSLIVYLPIGPVPVPVTLNGEATVSCSASVSDFVKVKLDVDLEAKLSASLQINPKSDDAMIKEGPWKSAASGHAYVTPDYDATWGKANVSCALPRVQLGAKVAGLAGPYLAITPSATIGDSPAAFSTTIAAGVSASVLGINVGSEIPLYTWKP